MRLIDAEDRRERAEEPLPEAVRPRRRGRRAGVYVSLAGVAALPLLAVWWISLARERGL